MTRRTLAFATAVVASCSVAASAPAVAGSATAPFKIHASVKLMPGGGATLVQKGSFNGTPLGRGTAKVRTQVGKGRGALLTFTLSNSRGEVRGSGNCTVTFKGSKIRYDGTAKITGGSGAFSGIRTNRLHFAGSGEISGETFAVDLTGPSS